MQYKEFDICFVNNVLQHNIFSEKRKIISRIHNALKPNGILFLNESTVMEETKTQLTYSGWITFIEDQGFKFLESCFPNKDGLNEKYVFRKV